MRTETLSLALTISVLAGAGEAHASFVGNSDIQWSLDTTTVNLHDPWAVNAALTAGYASPFVDYFTPGLPGGPPNVYGDGTADYGLVNVYAVLHDWNTHNSPFGGFWGYIDIVTPLMGITHRQIADFFSINAAQPPQNSQYLSFESTSYMATYGASGYGTHWASYYINDDGYITVPSNFVPLPRARKSVCGQLKTGEALRANTAIFSCNQKYTLALTVNGQLILSEFWSGKVHWYTGAAGISDYALIVQPDGDVVQYRPNWMRVVESGTAGHPGAILYLTDAGHLEVRSGGTLLSRIY